MNDDDNPRPSKARRHDAEAPVAEVDDRLAEKLDNILKLNASSSSRFKFHTNRPKTGSRNDPKDLADDPCLVLKIKPRNLSKDEVKKRLVEKYDTLVPELNPSRHEVKGVKVLSVTESVEFGKNESKRQMERQLKLNSVAGNQSAFNSQFRSFYFKDGYDEDDEDGSENDISGDDQKAR